MCMETILPIELYKCSIPTQLTEPAVRLNEETAKPKIETFEDVRKFLSTIPSIGRGGCGISTLAMYRWLAVNHQLNSDTKFAYLYRSQWDGEEMLAQNKAFIENGEGKPTSCSHCVIFHNGVLQDSERNYIATDYDLTHMIDDVYFLISSINVVGDWNSEFDRGTQNPYIAKVLGINLDDITL